MKNTVSGQLKTFKAKLHNKGCHGNPEEEHLIKTGDFRGGFLEELLLKLKY